MKTALILLHLHASIFAIQHIGVVASSESYQGKIMKQKVIQTLEEIGTFETQYYLGPELSEEVIQKAKLQHLKLITDRALASWKPLRVVDRRLMADLLNELDPLTGSGKTLARAYLALSLSEWQEKHLEKARKYAERSFNLLPINWESLFPDWSWADEGWLGYESFLRKARFRENARCKIRLSGKSDHDTVVMNGEVVDQLSLMVGQPYQIEVRRRGFTLLKERFQCDRSGIYIKLLNPAKNSERYIRSSPIDNLMKKRKWDSLIIVIQSNPIRVLLYTASLKRWDAIPLRVPITVGEWSGSVLTWRVPFDIPRTVSVLEKHYQGNHKIPDRPKSPSESGSEWYNNWKFWTAAGGVIVAGIVAVTILGDSGEEVAHPPIPLNLQITQ